MCALVTSKRGLGLRFKNSIGAEPGQWKSSIDECLLDFHYGRPSASESQELLIIEASLKYRVAGESWRLKVVTVTDSALDLG